MRSILPKPLLELVGGRDDADLVLQMRRRDPASAGLLFDRYGKTAYRLALRILGDQEAAEAAVSEAMLLCWNRAEDFKDLRGFGIGLSFLLATYSNAIDQKRGPQAKQLLRRSLFRDWAQSFDSDQAQLTFLSLRKLTPNERRLLDLSFFEGASPMQVMDQMSLTLVEMDALVKSALGKLGFG